MSHPASDPRSAPPALPTPPHSSLLPQLLVVLLLAAAIVWYLWFGRGPELVFTNQLAAPVTLVVGERTDTVPAGGTVQRRMARNRAGVAEWELIRPLSANRMPMGVAIRGSAAIPAKARGSTRLTAESWGSDADYFAPLITNETPGPLRIMVNAGLQGAQGCDCAVRPGARRVFIGYYPLYRNSTVQAQASESRQAAFQDVGAKVTSPDGTIGLLFDDQHLR